MLKVYSPPTDNFVIITYMYHTHDVVISLLIKYGQNLLAELLATRPVTIHEFHPNGMDCLNKTFLETFSTFNIHHAVYMVSFPF